MVGYAGSDVRISGSYSLADVRAEASGLAYAGGLAGSAQGPIVDSYAGGSASITTTNQTGSSVYAGGLVGVLEGNGSITGSYATGRAHVAGSSGSAQAGGLVGNSTGPIVDSYATGDAESSGPGADAGGLVAHSSGSITGSYATGDATADGRDVEAGGMAGEAEGAITASYATGAATATGSNNAYAGGLIGNIDGGATIRASYATGNATASGSNIQAAGGLVGNTEAGLDIRESYSTSRSTAIGSASADDTLLGGLLGRGSATVAASYWDIASAMATTSAAGMGTSTLALQTPTDTSTSTIPNNPYVTWDDYDLDNSTSTGDAAGKDNPWDFGTNWQYPILVWSTSTRASQQRPMATLKLSLDAISENRGVSYLSASLDRMSNVTTTLEVASAANGIDVNMSGTTVTIWPDGSSTRVKVSAIDDAVYKARSAGFTGQVQAGGSGAHNPAPVTLTLTDDEAPPPPSDGVGTAPAPTPEPTATPAPTATPIPVTVVPDSQITPVPAPEMGVAATVHPNLSKTLTSGNVSVTFPPASRPWSFQATLDTAQDACDTAGNDSGVTLPCATVQVYDTMGSAESSVTLLAPAQLRVVLSDDEVSALGGLAALLSAHSSDGLNLVVRNGPDDDWRKINMDLDISSGGAVLTSSARRFPSTFAVAADRAVFADVLALLRGEQPPSIPTSVPASTDPIPTPPKVGGPTAPTALLLALLAASALLATAGWVALRPRRIKTP